MAPQNLFSVSDFIALTNQTLEYAYSSVAIEGEVSSFKLNQGKYVFFDLKDAQGSIGCFMMAFSLRVPIEDGMKVVVTGVPKLTQWGKFSITVRSIAPRGEGAIKKSFELLKEKLQGEGLFASERKRSVPYPPQHIAVVSSVEAAGYADFIKIIDERWGGMRVDAHHVQVQGAPAADQIIAAFAAINEQEVLPDAIVLIRGGGSADDLAVFNDELLVRAVAASRVPTVAGIGHEVDETLVDLVADVRASTPSNAAQLLVPDKRDVGAKIVDSLDAMERVVAQQYESIYHTMYGELRGIVRHIDDHVGEIERTTQTLAQALQALHPLRVLERGYALVRGDARVGSLLEIETKDSIMKAEVHSVKSK